MTTTTTNTPMSRQGLTPGRHICVDDLRYPVGTEIVYGDRKFSLNSSSWNSFFIASPLVISYLTHDVREHLQIQYRQLLVACLPRPLTQFHVLSGQCLKGNIPKQSYEDINPGPLLRGGIMSDGDTFHHSTARTTRG